MPARPLSLQPHLVPKSAKAFVELMEKVWDGYLYDRYHDAFASAIEFNAKPIARLSRELEEDGPATIFEFPDGSRAVIFDHGSGCREE